MSRSCGSATAGTATTSCTVAASCRQLTSTSGGRRVDGARSTARSSSVSGLLAGSWGALGTTTDSASAASLPSAVLDRSRGPDARASRSRRPHAAATTSPRPARAQRGSRCRPARARIPNRVGTEHVLRPSDRGIPPGSSGRRRCSRVRSCRCRATGSATAPVHAGYHATPSARPRAQRSSPDDMRRPRAGGPGPSLSERGAPPRTSVAPRRCGSVRPVLRFRDGVRAQALGQPPVHLGVDVATVAVCDPSRQRGRRRGRPRAARSPSTAVTVAVRGTSRSRAISPT